MLRVEAIFTSIRKSNPIKLLLQALSLAAVSLAMSVGSAFAHGAGVDHDRSQAHAAATYAEAQASHAGDVALDLFQAVRAVVISAPCTGGPSEQPVGGSCCGIACHAAATLTAVDSLGVCDLPGTRIVGLADLLEGRSNDRTERPPKLS